MSNAKAILADYISSITADSTCDSGHKYTSSEKTTIVDLWAEANPSEYCDAVSNELCDYPVSTILLLLSPNSNKPATDIARNTLALRLFNIIQADILSLEDELYWERHRDIKNTRHCGFWTEREVYA